MPKLQLSFHTSFALKKEDLRKILDVAKESDGLSSTLEQLMAKTGLGNKKVGPMKSWAARSGLISESHLSPVGRVIIDKDAYLKSSTTDWFMHFYLSLGDKGLAAVPNEPSEWGGWSWFVYSFLPANSNFRAENITYEANQVFENETPKKLEKNFRYVLRAYTESAALESCNFLQKVDGDKYFTGEADLPNPYLICYFLAKIWERDYGETMSVITDEVLNHKMGLAPVLGLEPDALQEQLNKLETFGLIEQRRTVPPFQIIRRWDSPLSLLEQAYAHTK